jgi:hypothetical protein
MIIELREYALVFFNLVTCFNYYDISIIYINNVLIYKIIYINIYNYDNKQVLHGSVVFVGLNWE